ncbi:MAG: M14 family metallopeptidase [Urechidicola sp.]|nr:M14 family metallopeptidase [Urechidicola sp.]
MKKYLKIAFLLLLSSVVISCANYKLKTYELPNPKDTSTKEISYQVKKIYTIDSLIFADNEFDAARLNDFLKLNDSTYQVVILPENEPINNSPYYAFRIWSSTSKEINLQLNYPTTTHRYWPKISVDGKNWQPIDSTNFSLQNADSVAQLKLTVNESKLWIAAQEIHTSTDAKNWATEIATHKGVRHSVAGKSKQNRDLIALDIYEGDAKEKELIVILSRQHPPELTGYFAMQFFIEELLKDTKLSNDFRKKYRVLVYPMVNPDGVDLGHWRHNTGGIDLNRDWAYYRQTEVNTIVNNIVNLAKKSKNKVILGLDFHSTQEDLYYSFTDDVHSVIYPFKDYWMAGIDSSIEGYTPDDQPYAIGDPISKAWFYNQFNAESITYEIGDETPRDFIKLKAEVAAREMMKLLILK